MHFQNQLRHIHAAFEEENQLRPHERYGQHYCYRKIFRIDSEHNKTVLNAITKEIGTEKYTSKQIKGMLPFFYTYMLVLHV